MLCLVFLWFISVCVSMKGRIFVKKELGMGKLRIRIDSWGERAWVCGWGGWVFIYIVGCK